MQIYTITLNPAYDVHANADTFGAGCENLAAITSREAGGKGVNISRALQSNGVPNTAVVVLGKDNCEEFKQDLKTAKIDAIYLERPGRIRENLTLHPADGPETRISFSGFSVEESILQDVLNVMSVDAQTVVTFTGRVPVGFSIDKVKEFLLELKRRGARLVVDSKSLTAEDIFELRPWLIKPNREEITEYLGCPVETPADAAKKAKIFADKQVTNVMVSMGEQGAVLLNDGKTYTAIPPKVQAISTVGAGDSTIAGFLAAIMMGETPSLCLKRAVSFGTAACLTTGTLPPQKADVEAIYNRTEVLE